MPKNIRINALPKALEDTKRHNESMVLNGKQVSRSNDKVFQVERASAILKKRGAIKPENKDAVNNLGAINVLFSLGVTVSNEPVDFSLLAVQTDSEAIENTSILDPSYNNLKNETTKIKDKFPNKADPFYELDNDLPKMKKNQTEKIKETKTTSNVETITADLVKRSLDNKSSKTLKQFKNL